MKEVQRLHSEIDRIEDQLRTSTTDNVTNSANINTLMLIQEKEKLLNEIRRLESIVKNEEEKVSLFDYRQFHQPSPKGGGFRKR